MTGTDLATSGNELTRFDADRKGRFLQLYRLTGQLQRAAQEAGISSTTVREHQKHDVDFRTACDEAYGDFKEAIESEIMRRAIFGWEEPVYQQGVLAGTIRKYSERLLELLAKRHIPEYKEKHEVTHTGTVGILGIPLQIGTKEDWVKRHGQTAEAEFEELPNDSEGSSRADPETET